MGTRVWAAVVLAATVLASAVGVNHASLVPEGARQAAGERVVQAGSVPRAQGQAQGQAQAPARRPTGSRPVLSRRPSIVLVLMDDFSMDLLQTMRSAREMRRRGASYPNSFVVDSLCCVSRTSLATGQFPHQTGVLTNTANTPNEHGPIGGWEAFDTYGNDARSVNVRLQQAGYTTGFIGKFLNEYEARHGVPPVTPPGWDEWRVIFGSAYDGWDFRSTHLDEDGEVRLEDHLAPWYGASDAEKDATYAGTVTEHMAVDFLRRHRDDPEPFFLQVSPYAPHSRVGPEGAWPGDPRFPPAFRDRPGHDSPDGNCGRVPCRRLTTADLPGFGDDQGDNAPRYADGSAATDWRGEAPAVAARAAREVLRNRARMVQSIDRMVERILAEVGPDTYVVLTSDNGFHIGQHGLGQGKGTAFESDVRVPLLVVGPRVPPGTRSETVSHIDLAPTFEELAGLEPAAYRAGTSLVPTLRDPAVDRRSVTFHEHTWAPSLGFDPDAFYSGGMMDRIPSYVAVRTRDALLVRYDLDPSWDGTEHAWEFYDYRDAAFERTNTFGRPGSRAAVRGLQRLLREFDACQEHVGDDAYPQGCRDLAVGNPGRSR